MQDLGITAIELLPVFEFNELEYYAPIPGTDFYRYNFWGYSTVAFFAPMARFSAEVRPPHAPAGFFSDPEGHRFWVRGVGGFAPSVPFTCDASCVAECTVRCSLAECKR